MNGNYINFSLEELEDGKILSVPNDFSYLVRTSNELRKKKLIDFEIEDLRLMIGQNISLDYLIPLALEKLRKDIMAEGNYYEGDLLNSVLGVEDTFWKQHEKLRTKVKELISANIQYIESFKTAREFKRHLSIFLDS